MFFSEEKNQKTLCPDACGHVAPPMVERGPGPVGWCVHYLRFGVVGDTLHDVAALEQPGVQAVHPAGQAGWVGRAVEDVFVETGHERGVVKPAVSALPSGDASMASAAASLPLCTANSPKPPALLASGTRPNTPMNMSAAWDSGVALSAGCPAAHQAVLVFPGLAVSPRTSKRRDEQWYKAYPRLEHYQTEWGHPSD